jgi:predicted ATP-dependent serine protease
MAIASASKSMQLKENAVVFGEVGLSGEVRHVPFADKRIAEAKKLGFDVAIGPRVRSGRSTLRDEPSGSDSKSKKPATLVSVSDVRSALNTFLAKD